MAGSDATTMLRDLRRAMSRHKKKAALLFLAVMGAAALAAFLLPKTYHSEAKLFVRLGRENSTLDPMTTLSPDTVVAVPQIRDNELNSVVEILRSRAMVEQVVDALGPDFILDQQSPAVEAAETELPEWLQRSWKQCRGAVNTAWDIAKQQLKRMDRSPELDQRERAVLFSVEQVGVSPARKANIIEVGCQGATPAWTQAVVAKLVQLYLDQHVRLNRPHGSLEFLAEQTTRAHRELTQKEEDLRGLKDSTLLVSPTGQRQSLVTLAARLKDELLQAEANRAVSEGRVQVLRKQVDGLPEREVTLQTDGFGNEATDRMRDQLYALEMRREEAAAKYTGSHPHMNHMEQQLAASRDIVDKQEPTRTQVTTARNQIHEQVQLALLQEEPVLASCQAKAGVLRDQLAALGSELKTFNESELQIAKMEREIELVQTSYRKYSTSLEQARIDQALESQRISNISVVQPATYEPRAVRPRKTTILGLGFVAALLGAVGLALLAEQMDRSLRDREDVEKKLNLAVFASVPRLSEKQLAINGNGRNHSDDYANAGSR